MLILIVSKYLQNISDKLCTDSFVIANLHPHCNFNFSDWIKSIEPVVMTGEAYYFQIQKGSYYNTIAPVWKSIPVKNE